MIRSIGRDFDEGILPRISEVRYEDEMDGIPSAPDVSNYLISEVNFIKENTSDWLPSAYFLPRNINFPLLGWECCNFECKQRSTCFWWYGRCRGWEEDEGLHLYCLVLGIRLQCINFEVNRDEANMVLLSEIKLNAVWNEVWCFISPLNYLGVIA